MTQTAAELQVAGSAAVNRSSRQERLQRIDRFVAGTRTAIFVRRADQVLMIRPDKTLRLNRSAVQILAGLYDRSGRGAAEVLPELAADMGTSVERVLEDTGNLVDAVAALLNEDDLAGSNNPALRFASFDRSLVRYPTLAEIALTYDCQNRCSFCYAASPHRRGQHRLLSTDEVKLVMERIFHEAHVPSLSFTGGEATLRRDLPELINHANRLGFRVNLISNGVCLADAGHAATLVDAGLHSAQLSLEAGSAALHDSVTGRRGSFAATVAGVRNLQRLGIHVHTNTTLCAANLDTADDLIRFAARELGLATLSMNMVIRTGEALAERARGMEVSYRQIAHRLPALLQTACQEKIRLVWYSPIPYCIFNPVLHGLGAKSCACIDGILSVDPSGQVLPCSSFAGGIGSLVEKPFASVYHSRAAAYWRRKRFVPPVCRSCCDVDVCAGACPLYWDAAGSFAELPVAGAEAPRPRRRWQRQRRRGGSFGVPPPDRPPQPPATGKEQQKWPG